MSTGEVGGLLESQSAPTHNRAKRQAETPIRPATRLRRRRRWRKSRNTERAATTQAIQAARVRLRSVARVHVQNPRLANLRENTGFRSRIRIRNAMAADATMD